MQVSELLQNASLSPLFLKNVLEQVINEWLYYVFISDD